MALGLPDAAALEIDRRLATVRARWPETRWIPTEDVHLTLAFLGQTPVDRLPRIEDALGRVASRTEALELAVLGAGSFGGRGRPRVAWLGIGVGRVEAMALTTDCRAALGLEPETDEPRPHLTVARHAPPELADALAATFADGRPMWRVEALVLYRSHLGPPRSRYEVVARWPLPMARPTG